jgi:uncharacterized Fe-S radical SAM superfamily protein PflX
VEAWLHKFLTSALDCSGLGNFTPPSLDLYLKNTYLNFGSMPLKVKYLQFNLKFCRLCVRACGVGRLGEVEVRTLS